MLSSAQLRKVTAEARPIIERQLADAEMLAGLREVVSAAGGDWGQLKALIKAQVQDERDDAGDGKRVRKILDKAQYATAYADMLGLANMNEKNSFPDDQSVDAEQDEFNAETGEITESQTVERPAPVEPDRRSGDQDGHTNSEAVALTNSDPLRSVASTREDEGANASEPEPGKGAPAGAKVEQSASAPVDPRAFIKQLRPHCLNPDACGGQGRNHCFSCSVKIKDDPAESEAA